MSSITTYHIRVRPTALVVKDDCILLVEYDDSNGIHYNLPGGGAVSFETMKEGALRELYEETMLKADVGPIAFVYEYAPHKDSSENTPNIHTLYIVFECYAKAGEVPRLPDHPDPNQSDVKWISITELSNITLYPNIKEQIKQYLKTRRNIEIIENHMLEKYLE